MKRPLTCDILHRNSIIKSSGNRVQLFSYSFIKKNLTSSFSLAVIMHLQQHYTCNSQNIKQIQNKEAESGLKF